MSLHTLIASTLAAQAPPPTVPIYCLDDKLVFQRVVRTDYARLQAAFRRQYGFASKFSETSARSGTLTFRGGERNAETITYGVIPHSGSAGVGIALLKMTVRLQGATDDLVGDEMCWQTFGIVNGE